MQLTRKNRKVYLVFQTVSRSHQPRLSGNTITCACSNRSSHLKLPLTNIMSLSAAIILLYRNTARELCLPRRCSAFSFRAVNDKTFGSDSFGRARDRTRLISFIFFKSHFICNLYRYISKWCNVVEACRRTLSSTPPYLTGSRPRVSVGNKTYKLHLKD
jgi:hypothetical protein